MKLIVCLDESVHNHIQRVNIYVFIEHVLVPVSLRLQDNRQFIITSKQRELNMWLAKT